MPSCCSLQDCLIKKSMDCDWWFADDVCVSILELPSRAKPCGGTVTLPCIRFLHIPQVPNLSLLCCIIKYITAQASKLKIHLIPSTGNKHPTLVTAACATLQSSWIIRRKPDGRAFADPGIHRQQHFPTGSCNAMTR